MRWRRARLEPAALGPTSLDRESDRLEHLIATTDNQALAEMARIKLRVVKFVRTTPSGMALAEGASPATFDESELKLPVPMKIADAVRLIDLSRQRPALEQIHANVPLAAIQQRDACPVSPVRVFSASTLTLPNYLKPRRGFETRIGLLFSALAGMMLGILNVWYDVGITMIAIFFASVVITPYLARGALKMLRFLLDHHVTVSWRGILINSRIIPWRAVESITLTVRDTTCDCEISFRDGNSTSASLECFEPSYDEWLACLRQHLSDHAPAATATEQRMCRLE